MAQAPRTQESGGWQSAIDWQTFFDNPDKLPIIGYDPLNDQVIVLQSTDTSVTGANTDLFTYDMRTGAWSKVKSAIATYDTDLTNFVINGSSELVIKKSNSATDAFYKWNGAAETTTAFQWTSKAYDFGHPALKKKVYKLLINAKGGSNMDVKIYYDDSSAATQTFSGLLDNGTTDFTKNALTVTTPTAFSYLTVEIVSNGTSNVAFEVNDIGILYRVLRQH